MLWVRVHYKILALNLCMCKLAWCFKSLVCSDFDVCSLLSQREKTKPIIGKHYFSEDWNLEQIIMSYHMKKGMSPEDNEAGWQC